MRFKIWKNILKLKLNLTEVKALSRGECVEDKVQFGSMSGESILYVIEPCDCNTIEVCYAIDQIRIFIPIHLSKNWINSNQNAISASSAEIGQLKIQIEKDFHCIRQSIPNHSTINHYPTQMRIVS